jgi:hypothetical protein
MNMQARTAQVVSFRPAGAPVVVDVDVKEQSSKTFNADFMARLRAANDMSRWLRQNGHPPMTTHLQGRMPAIHVDGAAARLLITQARGFTGRRVDDTYRHCSVELRDCLVTWFEPL